MSRKLSLYILLAALLCVCVIPFSAGAAYAQTPEIITPTIGSTISTREVTFTWSTAENVTEYWLSVGTTQESLSTSPWGDIFSGGSGANAAITVSGIPLRGNDLYVRLWYKDATGWDSFQDYTYTTLFVETEPPELISPAPDGIISSTTTTFEWTSGGTNIEEYFVGVALSQSSFTNSPWSDIYAGSTGVNTAVTVANIPLLGENIYFRIWYKDDTGWGKYVDYVLDAVEVDYVKPAMISPSIDTYIEQGTVRFTWAKDSNYISEYFIGVAINPDSLGRTPWGDVFSGSAGNQNTILVSGIPLNIDYLYIRISYKIFGRWLFEDFVYRVPVVADNYPNLISPERWSIVNTRNVTFERSEVAWIKGYALAVGTSYDQINSAPWGDLYFGLMNSSTTQVVNNIPMGTSIYVRFWFLRSDTNVWEYKDYRYDTQAILPEIITPAVGTIITQNDISFEWSSGSDVVEYMIGVGTTEAMLSVEPYGDILASMSTGLGLTKNVMGIPDETSEIYARLSYRVGVSWEHIIYQYDVDITTDINCGNNQLEPPEECDDGNNENGDGCSSDCRDENIVIDVEIISPVPGSTLDELIVDFEWTEGPVGSVYGLSMGTCDNQSECIANIYTQSNITEVIHSVTGIPLNGNLVYVTLLIEASGQSVEKKYTYNTIDTVRVPGDIFSPRPGTTITSSTVRFEWEPLDEPVDRYIFFVGTCNIGSCLSDVYGEDVGQATAVTVLQFPLNGLSKYATVAFVFLDKPTEFRTFQYETTTVDGCGNGQVDPGEQCDGNIIESCMIDGYDGMWSCLAICQFSECMTSDFCGDGNITGLEECDDMNTVDDDECSNACTINAGNVTMFNDYDAIDNTLIIYNVNALGGQVLAEYYAAARSIPVDQICGVKLPVGMYATKDHLLGARKTIVENCICDHIPVGERPSPCDITNLHNIAVKSPISHMAIMRGMPSRIFNTGWITDNEEPPFDYYLSYLLYRNEDIFGSSDGRVDPDLYQGSALDDVDFQPADIISGMSRSLIPEFDKFVAYGRIEAITVDRTMELIDRIIIAEEQGFQGNVFIAKNFVSNNLLGYEPFRFMSELTNSLADACLIKTDWEESCRAGFSYNGHVPGEQNSSEVPITNIANPINASFYVGPDPFTDGTNGGNTNAHRAFDGFDNMLNWHVNTSNCTELCADFSTPAERDNCRAASLDYFKEINTECVGAAPGFLAHQVRSWPVQNYGFGPAGWSLVGGGNGAVERTPPQFKETGGYTDLNFVDMKYVSFGTDIQSPNPVCDLEIGQEPCEEFVAVNMRKSIDIQPDVLNPGSYTFTYRIRYRNFASPSGSLQVKLYVFASNKQDYADTKIIAMDTGHSTWTLAQGILTVDNTFNDIQNIHLDIQSTLSSPIRGWIDIDAVELIDNQTASALIDIDTGSFNNPQLNVIEGDWAANVIDRMGGIGVWGSSSQHLTGGWAFSASHQKVLPAMMSGRTLGESLAMTPQHYSGLIYADPLYRPSAVKIYMESDRFSALNSASNGGMTFDNTNSDKDLNLVVWHGSANTATTQWELSYCDNHSIITCNNPLSWIDFDFGTGIQLSDVVSMDLMNFVSDIEVAQDITIRLKVFNPGQESDSIYNYVYFNYQPSTQGVGNEDIEVIPMSMNVMPTVQIHPLPMKEPALIDSGYTIE